MTTPVQMTKTKSWVAALGGLLTVVVPFILQVSTYLPQPWPAVIGGVIALLTVFGVYRVPNQVIVPSQAPAAPQQPPTSPQQPPASGGWTNPWK